METLLGDTKKECLENGEKGECLNQQSNVCVTSRELCREQDVTVDAETVETDVGTVEEEKKNDAEDSIGDTEGDLSEEHQAIVEHLKKIMVERRTGIGVMFKKVDKKVLKVQTDRANEANKYLKSNTE